MGIVAEQGAASLSAKLNGRKWIPMKVRREVQVVV